jgi:hypothetical protein
MISPIRLSPIDWSMVQFAVLALCTAGGIFCAFRFANPHEMQRALLTLRERAEDPRPRYLAAQENNAEAEIQQTDERAQPERYRNSNLIVAQRAFDPSPVSMSATGSH